MKATRFASALFVMLLVCANLLQAQTTAPKSVPATSAATTTASPNLAKLDVSAMLDQMQAASAEDQADAPSPLQIVVQFLQLQPAQQTVFGELLQARQTAVMPLFQGIAEREQQVLALASSGGNPAQIGLLVTQIYAMKQQIMQTQQAFLSNLANLLDDDQKQRFAAVQFAVQLQPVIPAFQALSLI
ncbi:MAG: hypothetical protein ABSG69_12845 [Candidatus Acidiferrum sp.]